MSVDLSYLLGDARAQPQTAPVLRRDGMLRRAVSWIPLHPDWGMRDLVSGQRPNNVVGMSAPRARPNARVGGQYWHFGGSGYVDFDDAQFLASFASGAPVTITWLEISGTQSASFPRILNWALSDDTTSSFGVWHGASGGSYELMVGRHGNSVLFPVGGLTAGQVERYVLQCLAGPGNTSLSNFRLWRNGVLVGTATGNPASGAVVLSAGQHRIGGRRSDGATLWVGQIGDIGVISGLPSDREIQDYMCDPYGVAYARPRGVVFVGASGGYSGAVAAGTTATAGSAIAGTQTHVGVSAPGTSATAGTEPAGTQTHQGAVAAGSTATVGSTTAGTSAYAGAVAAGASATVGASPTGTQVHQGVVAAGTSATVGSAPAGTQVHVGAVAAGVSATLGSTVAGGGDVYSGTVAAGASATLGSAPAGTQTHVGTVAAGASATVGASPTGTQVHQGVVAAGVSVTVGSTVEGGGSVYSGAVAAGATATAGSAPAGTQSHVGVVSTSIIATLGSAPAGTQIYVGAVAAGVSATVGGTLGAGGTASAAEVWAYELSPGVSAQQYVLEIHAMLTALSALAPCPSAASIADAVWSRELPL